MYVCIQPALSERRINRPHHIHTIHTIQLSSQPARRTMHPIPQTRRQSQCFDATTLHHTLPYRRYRLDQLEETRRPVRTDDKTNLIIIITILLLPLLLLLILLALLLQLLFPQTTRLFLVQIWKDQVEDVAVPFDRLAFDAFADVLK
jgi:hypothetical protein